MSRAHWMLGAGAFGLASLVLALTAVRDSGLSGSSAAGLALAVAALLGLGLRGSRSPSVSSLDDPSLADARAALEARVDEARQARVELRQRAETAGRFREEFVAAVRHELKTPLNVILGFSEVLLQGVDGPLDARQQEDVEAIREGGEYLQQLVEAVLEEWVPDSDEPPAQLIEVGPLVLEVARLLTGQVLERPVTLRTDVEPGLAPLVIDSRRLRQVLINLGTNAIRATDRGEVCLRATSAEGSICLSVEDTGRGIASSDLERIFEEFEQVGDSASGTSGLGLALTRQLVEWQGGTIEVRSVLGEGSCFEIRLPLGGP